jgi:hypothetical protein
MERTHLVSVWNPTYGDDVIESHLRILRDGARGMREGHRTEDDVYVWWAKVRSSHRQQPLPHLDDVLAVQTEPTRNDPGPETHLYLTDYRSLYVGHLGQITCDDPRASKNEKRYVPKYYDKARLTADCWFRLWDMRRLVSDDTVSVVQVLQTLRNARYHDQPVSIYGGMIDLPLIVTDTVGARYFDPDRRAHLTGGQLWVEFDAQHAGLGAMERELRSNLFGDYAWHRLDPATRVFVATAEKIFRDHLDDGSFDLSPVIVELSKAVEVMCTAVLRPALEKAPADVMAQIRSDRLPSGWSVRAPSLAEFADIVGGSKQVSQYLRRVLRNGDWVVTSLPPILDQFAKVRNEVAHSRSAERSEVVRWREQLVGIGCEGALVQLARVEKA